MLGERVNLRLKLFRSGNNSIHQPGHTFAGSLRTDVILNDYHAFLKKNTFEKACDLAWRDFEDAVQLMAASESACDYLVTRNPGDYPDQNLTVVQPAEFLAVWAANQSSGN